MMISRFITRWRSKSQAKKPVPGMLEPELPPTSIILVPGGWHTAFHLGPIIDVLEQTRGATLVLPEESNEYNDQLRQSLSAWKSHKPEANTHKTKANPSLRVLPCPLYAAGPKQERHAKFRDDVEVILKFIRSEAEDKNRQICLVAHSAAGIAALQAVNEYLSSLPSASTSQLKQIICVSALCGGRNNGAKAGIEAGWVAIDSATDLMLVKNTEPFFYNDMPLEAAKPFSAALVPHVMGEAATRTELMTSEAFRDVPNKTYILCTQDAVVPPAFQEMQAQEHGMTLFKMEAAHCPFISKPEEFAQIVLGLISATAKPSKS